MSRKGEHWTLRNNIFQFGKKFGRYIKNILVFQLIMRKHGSSWMLSVRHWMQSIKDNQNKSSCNRYCWRFARNWKKGARMKKIRAEPGKHRLDNGFMKWSQETIEANKKTGHGITDKKETCPNTPTH